MCALQQCLTEVEKRRRRKGEVTLSTHTNSKCYMIINHLQHTRKSTFIYNHYKKLNKTVTEWFYEGKYTQNKFSMINIRQYTHNLTRTITVQHLYKQKYLRRFLIQRYIDDLARSLPMVVLYYTNQQIHVNRPYSDHIHLLNSKFQD